MKKIELGEFGNQHNSQMTLASGWQKMRESIDRALNALTSESEFSPRTTKLLSLSFLVIAGSLCFMTYTKTSFFGLKKTDINIAPKFISAAISLGMLAPLYARDILKWSKSVYGIIAFFLFWLVFSGMVEIALGGKNTSIKYYLVGSAVLLSWLGMKGVAGFAWILAFAACIYGIVSTNIAMGFYGAAFLISSFLGCILHSGMGPSDFINGMKDEFSNYTSGARRQISDDVAASRSIMTP